MNRKEALAANSPRYFTGKPCLNGHLAERYTLNKTCCECANAIANKTKAKDRKKYSESSSKWGRENPAKLAEYQLRRNRKNPGKRNTLTANYRSGKDKRTPVWLTEDDRWMIEQAYDLAALRTKMFGFPWHVDHVIPLRGRNVSGLHTPLNLQVIPGAENVKKGNRYGCVAN